LYRGDATLGDTRGETSWYPPGARGDTIVGDADPNPPSGLCTVGVSSLTGDPIGECPKSVPKLNPAPRSCEATPGDMTVGEANPASLFS
jgi:hypothetical protein